MIRVAVAGHFDPLHIGHLRHIKKAKELYPHVYLMVFVARDDQCIKKKGFVFMPCVERIEIIESLKWVDFVAGNLDRGLDCAYTLRHYKPDVFAKGGEYNESNLPQSEIDVCRELGIKIVYGVGEKLNSSTEMLKKVSREIL